MPPLFFSRNHGPAAVFCGNKRNSLCSISILIAFAEKPQATKKANLSIKTTDSPKVEFQFVNV